MAIDIPQLMADMRNAATQVLERDVTTLKGFTHRQMEAIARQAAFVEAGILNGEITEATREFFLDSLKDMVLNFVRTLQGILAVTIEKVWNAIVQVIWQAIEMGTGVVLI